MNVGDRVTVTNPNSSFFGRQGVVKASGEYVVLDGETGERTFKDSSLTVNNPIPNAWPKLLFEDTFSGTSLDTTKWGTYGPMWESHGGAFLRDQSALSVANGILTITAYSKIVNGVARTISGGVASKVNFVPPVRIEARVRTDRDASDTMSGVLLTWPISEKWPYDGELDFYETGTIPGDRSKFNSYLHHYRASTGGDQTWIGHPAAADQWHDMAMEWHPDRIIVYRDGVKAGELTDPLKVPPGPMRVTAQLDSFTKYAIPSPVRLQVDSYRVWGK